MSATRHGNHRTFRNEDLVLPNIVRVFDANVTESRRGICDYFAMENVPGGSLEKFRHDYDALKDRLNGIGHFDLVV